jgi:hypothetical protein
MNLLTSEEAVAACRGCRPGTASNRHVVYQVEEEEEEDGGEAAGHAGRRTRAEYEGEEAAPAVARPAAL